MSARGQTDQPTTALQASTAAQATMAMQAVGPDAATALLPVIPPLPPRSGPGPLQPTGPSEARLRVFRFLSPALALLAVALLPVAAATTNLLALDGWGLAKVLSPAAWAALLCAIAACVTELSAPRVRIPMLATATGVLILCSTGLPSVLEPTARFGTSYTIAGFVDVLSMRHGVPPQGIDARFSWPAFFAQWAFFRDAAGATQLDSVLRWFPPVVVAVWAIGIYALARSMLGGNRAPWVAAWLFVGLNWIEQDYFSPQAMGIVLLLTVLTFALGPLATRRTDAAGAPGWPMSPPDAPRLPLLRRWMVSAMTPPNRPTLPARQLLLIYFCASLCLLAVIPEHQLTPFAIIGQLALLAVVGRFRGRGLVLVGTVAVLVFILIGAREIWLSQLSLLVGGGGVQSGVADRLAGDTGQIDVKYLRVIMAGLTYVIGVIGAWVYWRRRRDLVPIGLAVVPMAIAVQGYGGEGFLRIVLFGLPILSILGADALRALVRKLPMMRAVLALGFVVLFGLLVLIRGGNDSYQVVFPQELAMLRQVLATTPPGDKVMPLASVGPNGVEGVGKFFGGGTIETCPALAFDPVRCAEAQDPNVIVTYLSVEKWGVYLQGKPAGWSLKAVKDIAATGKYVVAYQDGYNAVLKKVPEPGALAAANPDLPGQDGGDGSTIVDKKLDIWVWLTVLALLVVLGGRAWVVETGQGRLGRTPAKVRVLTFLSWVVMSVLVVLVGMQGGALLVNSIVTGTDPSKIATANADPAAPAAPVAPAGQPPPVGTAPPAAR